MRFLGTQSRKRYMLYFHCRRKCGTSWFSTVLGSRLHVEKKQRSWKKRVRDFDMLTCCEIETERVSTGFHKRSIIDTHCEMPWHIVETWYSEDAKRGRRPRPHSLFGKKAQERLGCHWSDYLVHLYSCEFSPLLACSC